MTKSRRAALLLAAAAILTCATGCTDEGAGDGDTPGLEPGVTLDAMDPLNWEIGPVLDGRNYSDGMPLHPAKHPEGWSIDMPYPDRSAGSVHYVTMPTGTLTDKTKITLRYRIEGDPEVKLVPRNYPESPALLTLYFQRNGDTWTAQGGYEAYRWFASFATRVGLKPVEDSTLEARFDENWTAILTSSRANNPQGYDAARANAARVGFVLGGGDGLGHGVYATGPARLVVTSFKVE